MAQTKPLSEAAQWFLRDFKRTLNSFTEEMGAQIMVLDRNGHLINELQGTEEVCKLVMATPEGRIRCRDSYKVTFSLAKTQKKPVFAKCYAGYASICVPIIIRDSVIGFIFCCGGRCREVISEEKLLKKFSRLADELGIIDKENFLKAAVERVSIVDKEDIDKRAERLTKLIEILAETALTPLKEVFG